MSMHENLMNFLAVFRLFECIIKQLLYSYYKLLKIQMIFCASIFLAVVQSIAKYPHNRVKNTES